MNKTAKSLIKTTFGLALTLASLAGIKEFKNAQKNSKQMVADAFVGTAEPSMVQVQTVVSEIPTYMTNNEGTRFTVVNNAETQATNEAVAAAESQDDEAGFNNNNDSTSKRGSAADRFTESALDKVGAESESDLEKDGFVPSDETQKILDELEKGDSNPSIDPTDDPNHGTNFDEIENLEPKQDSSEAGISNQATAYAITVGLAGGAIGAAAAIMFFLKRKLNASSVRKQGTRLIQDQNNIKTAEKLTELDTKISKKEEKGKTVSTRLANKRETAALKVTAKSQTTQNEKFDSDRLKKYASFAKWRNYGRYRNDELTKTGYKELNNGLIAYSKYLESNSPNSKESRKLLESAIASFNKAAPEIQKDAYFGNWSFSTNSQELNGKVELSQIPVFPFRYVQNQGLGLSEVQKTDLENFFNDVFAEKANNEPVVTYGTISYYTNEEQAPVQMKYAFDNHEAAKLLKSKLITLIPQEAKKVVIDEVNKGGKRVKEELKTEANIAKERALSEKAVSDFYKTYAQSETKQKPTDLGQGME